MENSKNDWDMISHWLRSMGIWNEKSGWVTGELILQVSLIFVARFLCTPGASGMLENPQLYDPVTDSWRNYHLSSGQYLPIMLQAWGRCWKIPFLLKDSFLQECHSFLTQRLNSKILGQWQRSWLMDGVCASVQKSLTGGGACLLFLSPSVLTVQKGLVSAAAWGQCWGLGQSSCQARVELVVTGFSASLIQSKARTSPRGWDKGEAWSSFSIQKSVLAKVEGRLAICVELEKQVSNMFYHSTTDKRAGFGVRLAKVWYPKSIINKLWVLSKMLISALSYPIWKMGIMLHLGLCKN